MQLYLSRKEQYAVVVLLLAIIGALFVLSYAYGKRDRVSDGGPLYSPTTDDTSAIVPAGAAPTEVVVHVAGAVRNPGVYTLPAGGRINDAVRLAGGPRTDGYPDALNLAEKLQDGERLYVPTRAEWQQVTASQGIPEFVTHDAGARQAATPRTITTTHTGIHETSATKLTLPAKSLPTTTASTSPSSQLTHRGTKELPKAPIHLNTATLEQLQQLPTVGASTAQKILDFRKAHGNFTDTNQLLGVGGIGPKKFEKMAPYLQL